MSERVVIKHCKIKGEVSRDYCEFTCWPEIKKTNDKLYASRCHCSFINVLKTEVRE